MYTCISFRRRAAILASASLSTLATASAPAQVTHDWLSTTSGNWYDGVNWSTGSPPSLTTHAARIAATGSPYTVTLSSSADIDSLILDSADATLSITGLTALRLHNELTLGSGGVIRISGPTSGGQGGGLRFYGSRSITGSGQIIFDTGTYSTILPLDTSAGAGLTIGSGVTVRTGLGSGEIGDDSFPLINQGILSSESGGTLRIHGSNWINSGQIRVGSGETLLSGTTTTAGLGTIVRIPGAGSLGLGARVDNAGATLDLATTGDLHLGGVITGGIVTSSDGSKLIPTSGGLGKYGTLENLTLDVDVDLGSIGRLGISGNVTLTGRTVSATGGHIVGYFSNGMLDGTGEVVVNGLPNSSNVTSAIGIKTLGPGITVRTGALPPGSSGGIDLTFSDNYGTIRAETSGMKVSIEGDDWRNHGTILLSAGELQLGGTFTPDALGTFSRTGGNLVLMGTLQNTGSTFDLSDTGSIVLDSMAGGAPTIIGGAVSGAEGMSVRNGYDAWVRGVTFDAPLTVGYSSTLNVHDGLTVNDTLVLQGGNEVSSSMILAYNGPHTIGGDGEIIFNTNQFNRILVTTTSGGTGGVLTIDPDVIVRTGTGGAVIDGALGSLINRGTITAQTAGKTINFIRGIHNEGTINAISGGEIALHHESYVNSGSIDARDGGVLSLRTAGGINFGSIKVHQGGALNLYVLALPPGAFSVTDSNVNVALAVTPDQFKALPLATNSPGVIAGGVIDATGTTGLELDASTGSLRLAGGRLKGGLFAATEGIGYLATNGVSTLEAVTLSAPLTIANSATLSVVGGITFDDASVTLQSTGTFSGARLTLSSPQTLTGLGTITFDGTTSTGAIRTSASGTTTIAPGVTVRTGTAGGNLGSGAATGAVLNQGTIAAITPGKTIAITGATLTNQGTLDAQNGGAITSSAALSNSGTISVGAGSTFTSTGAMNLVGGSLGGAGAVVAAAGAIVSGNVTKPGLGVLVVRGTGLQLGDSAKLDLTEGKLIVRATPTGTWDGMRYTGIAGMVDAGRGDAGNAAWDGAGILTSDARAINNGDLVSIGVAKVGDVRAVADTATTLFAGQTVLGSDTLAMVTWGGDATLDGKINIDDYGRIDGNVSQSGSVFGWFSGDFNYDGKINIDDYGIIDGNISRQGEPFPTAVPPVMEAPSVEGVAAVPEPASLGITALGAFATLSRRYRRILTDRVWCVSSW